MRRKDYYNTDICEMDYLPEDKFFDGRVICGNRLTDCKHYKEGICGAIPEK